MQGILFGKKDKKEFLDNLLYYHIYNHYLKLEKIYEDGEIMEETDLQRFKRSASFWGIKLGNPEYSFEMGEYLHSQKYKTFVGLNKNIFWDFYKNKKTLFDWECLYINELNKEQNYQIIYTTSYIAEELKQSKYVVGQYYTKDNKSLKNII